MKYIHPQIVIDPTKHNVLAASSNTTFRLTGIRTAKRELYSGGVTFGSLMKSLKSNAS